MHSGHWLGYSGDSLLLMLQALNEVHSTSAHRDLKPDNVMLTGLDSGRVGVKILDWASSCSIHEGMSC